MKAEYNEGPDALERFKEGMKSLFRVPKSAVLKPKQPLDKAVTSEKPTSADKD